MTLFNGIVGTVETYSVSTELRLTPQTVPPIVRSQMPVTIPSAALRQMTDEERTRVLNAAFDWTPEALENYLTVLDARLRVFEQRYEVLSTALNAALASGRLHETTEVSEWMFWTHLRSDLAGKARP